jgi:hypothetical protein
MQTKAARQPTGRHLAGHAASPPDLGDEERTSPDQLAVLHVTWRSAPEP